jgi:putative hydrolase of the HAD superfamily
MSSVPFVVKKLQRRRRRLLPDRGIGYTGAVNIQAVVFDYGGVISFFQTGDDMKDMAALAGIDPSLLGRIYWDNRSAYDQGRVNGREFFKDILAGVGVFADDGLLESLVDRDVRGWSRVNPQTETLVRDLKTAGLKTAVLSNMVRDFLERSAPALPVLSLMDAAVFSCDVDAVKPEERIYRILLDKLGAAPEETVFFDDLEANVEAAAALGIRAFLWRGPEEARRALRQCGIDL